MYFISYLDKNREELFKKYSEDELLNDINNYLTKSGNLNKLLNHYFEECIFKSCGKRTKISPMEVLGSDEMMATVLEYIESKPKFFKGTEIQNVKSYFRNSSSWVRKVANFPPKEARDIYFRYFDANSNEKLNVLDTSSGFGSRMASVLLNGHNYYGFDPNQELNSKLNEMLCFFNEKKLISDKQSCVLYCDGSENYKEELADSIDVSFTSPPYFDLEKYSNDDCGSTKNYNNYDLWVDCFLKPTVNNTTRYLKSGGYAMINTKNISNKYPCYDDFFNEFSHCEELEFVECFEMKIKSKKQYGMQYENKKGVISQSEKVMSFRKK